MKSFFIEIETFGLRQTNLADELGYFWPNYQHSFWYSESLVHFFPSFNHYFYKKLSLYIHIPNIYLGLEFEFDLGLQRIRDLAFGCPQSVARDIVIRSVLLSNSSSSTIYVLHDPLDWLASINKNPIMEFYDTHLSVLLHCFFSFQSNSNLGVLKFHALVISSF